MERLPIRICISLRMKTFIEFKSIFSPTFNEEEIKKLWTELKLNPPKKAPQTERTRLHIGERGGRYYKRTRADGTTYRDYTW